MRSSKFAYGFLALSKIDFFFMRPSKMNVVSAKRALFMHSIYQYLIGVLEVVLGDMVVFFIGKFLG